MKNSLWKVIFFFSLLLLPGVFQGGEEKSPAPAVKEYDLNIPYKDGATGIVFPGKMGEFVKRFVRINANYAIGTSIGYTAPGGISADIYIYLPGESAPRDPAALLQKNYLEARKLIFAMEQGKKREDMPEKEGLFFREETVPSPIPCKSASFTFTAGEETYGSILCMTIVKRKLLHLVKIRFSYPEELGKEGEKKWKAFREEIMKLLTPPPENKKEKA